MKAQLRAALEEVLYSELATKDFESEEVEFLIDKIIDQADERGVFDSYESEN